MPTGELGGALNRRLAPFHHIGQQGDAPGKARADARHVLLGAQGFDKQRVDPAFHIGLGAIDRRIQSFDGHRIGTGKDQGSR